MFTTNERCTMHKEHIPSFKPKNRGKIDTFIQWSCLMPQDRPPEWRTRGMFAKEIGISDNCLDLWARSEYFRHEVGRISKADRFVRSTNIKNKVYEKAVNGDMVAAKLWKEWVEGINDKLDVKTEGTVLTTTSLSEYLQARNKLHKE
jgi:hypothetical protein